MNPAWFFLPSWIVAFLAFIGLSIISYWCLNLIKHLISRSIFKEPYRNIEQTKYFLLLEENKKLKTKIDELEETNNQIIQSLVKQLQDKL
jgi:predicted nucleic acid-binding protein